MYIAAVPNRNTLAQELDVREADEDDLYAAMDWLLERQARIEQQLAGSAPEPRGRRCSVT